ncbi:MAG: DUF1641 domain-containing protein [Firmicutes bacterium]|nr:DUF1641 domain-containing protein [Bacillota bacterium]
MAKAIVAIKPPERSPEVLQEQALAQVNATLAAHADSVTSFVELLAALDEAGVLSGAAAMLSQGQELIEIVVRQAGKPEAAGGVKNALKLAQVLGSDLTPLFRLLDAAGTASEQAPELTGVMSLMKAARDPDVMAGAAWMLGLLRSVGAGLRADERGSRG